MKKLKATKKSKKHSFEAEYFAGYYKAMVGEFADADLNRAVNWFWGWFQALKKDLKLDNPNKRQVLEVGCSIGGASRILTDYGFSVTATDVSKYAVDRAKKLSPDINFQVWDVMKPFPKKTQKFDLIFGFEVIEHLDDPVTALKNMRSMLTPTGQVLFSTPFPFDYVYLDPTHVSVHSPDEWVEIFKKAGYTKLKLKKRLFIPFLYRLSKHLHFSLPYSVNTPYINSTLFILGR